MFAQAFVTGEHMLAEEDICEGWIKSDLEFYFQIRKIEEDEEKHSYCLICTRYMQ